MSCTKAQLESAKRWRERNREIVREKARAYYQKTRIDWKGQWTKRFPERARKSKKRQHLKKYDLTYEQFEAMLQSQKNLCAICEAPEPIASRFLAVDHDHKTKKVRALLCHLCNRMLGLAREDPAVLRAAANYIEHHR